MSETIAIYGITGALGREVQVALEVDHEGLGDLIAVAGARSAGQSVRWRGASVTLLGPGEVTASDVDIAVLATPAEVVVREAPRLLAAGARVIDASGTLAATPLPSGVKTPAPLVWPGLAAAPAVDLEVVSLVALPSPVTSTLAPILEAVAGAQRVHGVPRPIACDVVALGGASTAGRRGVEALSRQSVGLLGSQAIIDPAPFTHALAFNALSDEPSTALVAESRVQSEIARLVPSVGALAMSLVSVTIPTFSGLALIITLRSATPFDATALAAIRAAFTAHPELGLGLADDDEEPDEDTSEAIADEDDDDELAALEAAEPPESEALALRDVLDQDEVRLAAPSLTIDGALRIVAFADPLHRTAVAAQRIIARWVEAAEADA